MVYIWRSEYQLASRASRQRISSRAKSCGPEPTCFAPQRDTLTRLLNRGDSEAARCAKLPVLHRAGWGRRGPGGTPRETTASSQFEDGQSCPCELQNSFDERWAQRRAAGEGTGTAVGGGPYDITAGDAFTWKSDRAEVTLSLTSEGWIVQYSTVGRLLGPPQVLHQARHRDAKHATWDVMARVQSASHNEAEMVRAGHSAVQWIKSRPRWSELSLGGQSSGR